MERVIERMEGLRQEEFNQVHLHCDTEIKEIVQSSSECDPATSDPLPVFKTQIICRTHNVSSAIE